MNLLPDTHILIWALTDSVRLPEAARSMIQSPENTIFFSVISLWEVVMKHNAHPMEMPFSGYDFYVACLNSGFLVLDGKPEHILTVDSLQYSGDPPIHKDPFDRLLIAQAKSEKMCFVTSDTRLRHYHESCIFIV